MSSAGSQDADRTRASVSTQEGVAWRWMRKLRQEGPLAILRRRLAWYRRRFQKENWYVGKFVELTGNKVTIRGMRFNVDNPTIRTRQKSWMYFGVYELSELDFVEKYVSPTDMVVEVGASIGVVSCKTNAKLADPRRHIVVEANPRLIPTLERNRRDNGAKFTIVHGAVAYGAPEVEFQLAESFLSGTVRDGQGEKVRVAAATISELVGRLGGGPVTLICDIEGTELEVVANELETLARSVKLIIMETHPRAVGTDQCEAMLRSLYQAGFQLLEESRGVVALRNNRLSHGAPGPGTGGARACDSAGTLVKEGA